MRLYRLSALRHAAGIKKKSNNKSLNVNNANKNTGNKKRPVRRKLPNNS